MKRLLAKILILAIVIVAVFQLSATPVLAWGDTGHEVIVQIAYENLSPHAKQALDRILAEDPRQRTLYEAATWPDKIRHSPDVPESDRHPSRHFVNIPIINGQIMPVSQRAALYHNPECVVYGIPYYARQLTAPGMSDLQRADCLSWVIHLVGDIHQPLHCVTRVTDEHPAPEGDEGGNLYYIRAPHTTPTGRIGVHDIKLHAYWDQAPDRIAPGLAIPALAAQIEAAHPKASYPDSDSATMWDAAKWADESCDLAAMVYSTPEDQVVSDSYASQVIAVTSDRLAHAGYRLAAVLNEIFK